MYKLLKSCIMKTCFEQNKDNKFKCIYNLISSCSTCKYSKINKLVCIAIFSKHIIYS